MKKIVYIVLFIITSLMTSCVNIPDPYYKDPIIIHYGSQLHCEGKVFDKHIEYSGGYSYYYLYILDTYNNIYHVEVNWSTWYYTNIGDYVIF